MRYRHDVLVMAVVAACALVPRLSLGVSSRRPRPAYWPESEYPAGRKLKDGRIGCRMEMRQLVATYRKDKLIIKCATEDANSHLGTHAVGDQMRYSIAIGPRENKYFGSAKHGRDGGFLAIKIAWTDGTGKKVVDVDERKNKAGC